MIVQQEKSVGYAHCYGCINARCSTAISIASQHMCMYSTYRSSSSSSSTALSHRHCVYSHCRSSALFVSEHRVAAVHVSMRRPHPSLAVTALVQIAVLCSAMCCSHVDSSFITVNTSAEGVYWFEQDGKQFVSKGVTCINYDGDYSPKTGHWPYKENVEKRYHNNQTAWAVNTTQRLNDWGFNSAAAWTYDLPLVMPWLDYYAVELGLTKAVGDDFFSQEFVDKAVGIISKNVALYGNDSKLIGYFTSNEVIWGSYVDEWPVYFRENMTILLQYLSFNSSAPGFSKAISFLKGRYANIEALNTAWHIDATSFETIAEKVPFWTPPTKQRLDDYHQFAVLAATQYFQLTHQLIRQYDPNHLILGCRYSFWEMPDDIVQAEAPYTDVTSYNGYWWWPDFPMKTYISRLHSLSQRPVLISEFSFRALDSGLPNTKGAGFPLLTQKERATHYAKFVEDCMSLPECVGYHWWEWVDDPATGRFDGENSNFGLVDIEDNAWVTLTDQVAISNAQAESLHMQSQQQEK